MNCPSCGEKVRTIGHAERQVLGQHGKGGWVDITEEVRADYYCLNCSYTFTDEELVQLGVLTPAHLQRWESKLNCPACGRGAYTIGYTEHEMLGLDEKGEWVCVSEETRPEYYCLQCKRTFTNEELVQLGVLTKDHPEKAVGW